MARDQDLVKPSSEPEQFFHQYRREENLLPKIPQIEEDQENTTIMADEQATHRIVREVKIQLLTNLTSPFQKPIAGGNFKLKHNMVLLLISSGQFTGLSHKDPHVYLWNSVELNDTYILMSVNADNMKKTLFPFSLFREAKKWLNAELKNSITLWDDMAIKFLIQFFPSGKTARLHSDMVCFKQHSYENI